MDRFSPQNIFLQAVSLQLGAGIEGAFRENEIIEYMKLPESHIPLLIMPIGYETRHGI